MRTDLRFAGFEGGGSALLGPDGFDVLFGYGVDAEVPDVEVDLVVAEDFDQGVFAEVEGLGGGELHPVATGEVFLAGFDDVGLLAVGVDSADTEAVDDA
jgi:hypothetical protein